MIHHVDVVLAFLAIVILIYAGLHDIATRTLPNWISLVILFIGIGLRLSDHSLFHAALIAVAVFIFLFAIWVLNVMGGGDVKLWAAAVLLIPPHVLPELNFFMQVFIFGGILGIIYLILWPMMPKGWTPQPKAFWRRILRVEIRRISRKGPLPYAVAISASAIIALSQVIR